MQKLHHAKPVATIETRQSAQKSIASEMLRDSLVQKINSNHTNQTKNHLTIEK
jgi:hypothetical protein